MDPPVNVLGAVGITGLQHLHKLVVHAFHHREDTAADTVRSRLAQRQHHGLNTCTHVQLHAGYSTEPPGTKTTSRAQYMHARTTARRIQPRIQYGVAWHKDNITGSIHAHTYNRTQDTAADTVRSRLAQRQHHGLNTCTHVQLHATTVC